MVISDQTSGQTLIAFGDNWITQPKDTFAYPELITPDFAIYVGSMSEVSFGPPPYKTWRAHVLVKIIKQKENDQIIKELQGIVFEQIAYLSQVNEGPHVSCLSSDFPLTSSGDRNTVVLAAKNAVLTTKQMVDLTKSVRMDCPQNNP